MRKAASTPVGPDPGAVVTFWREAGPDRWFRKDLNFDRSLAARFHAAHLLAAERRLDDWNRTAHGALALQILLDQLPRNVYRGNAHAWATDPLALHLALAAIDAGLDEQVEAGLRMFCYMALMHSEDIVVQRRSLQLFAALGGSPLEHAQTHHDIIERFGRFPHRNRALGRVSTPAEKAFLDAGGFAG
jgi:uncharacterized protein (DUF924 family)